MLAQWRGSRWGVQGSGFRVQSSEFGDSLTRGFSKILNPDRPSRSRSHMATSQRLTTDHGGHERK